MNLIIDQAIDKDQEAIHWYDRFDRIFRNIKHVNVINNAIS